MNQGKYVFAQFMELFPRHEFSQCVKKYNGEYRLKKFSCLDQFSVMCFSQLSSRDSLRSAIMCLDAHKSKLYHLWFRCIPARKTVADANENRDWRIYQDFAMVLISQAQWLYQWESTEFNDIEGSIYALDSSTIDLCMNLFPWATFRTTKSGIKLHTLLDIRTHIPTFIHISEAACADVNIWDSITLEIGSWYLVDRGYIDYEQYFRLTTSSCYFVTRTKVNVKWTRILSNPISDSDKEAGIRSDQIMKFSWLNSQKEYPERIRRVRYYDKKTKKYLTFMTNNMTVSPFVIAELYRSRWSVELFFKWIKQHLCIRNFFGRTENAVKTQIWIAVTTYVLAAVLKKQLNLTQSLYEILQVLWVSVFDKSPISSLFSWENYRNETEWDQTSLF